MKTTSILESIRNKINKIEKSNAEASQTATEAHDDFEYIDDNSKSLVDSKHVSGTKNTDPTNPNQETAQATDEDFDFLSENGGEEVTVEQPANLSSPARMASPAPVNNNVASAAENKDDDLDLDNIDIDDLESIPEKTVTPASKDDLDLDNIDIDDLEDNNPLTAPANMTDPLPPLEDVPVATQPVQSVQPASNQTNNGLDLDSEVEEPVSEVQANTQQTNTQQIQYQQAAPVQNNYQESAQNIMNNSNKTRILSEEIARQTQDVVRDIINSVPKPQNQQVLSGTSPAFRSGETIEDMVSAILAPKLEQWINENLPPMVEKIVKSEIKRLLPRDDH